MEPEVSCSFPGLIRCSIARRTGRIPPISPAVASRGLAIDVDTPAFIDRLPDEAIPFMVAEAIEYRLVHPADREVIEAQRVDYLERKSPKVYAEELLAVLARL
jgi:hypothetical protein